MAVFAPSYLVFGMIVTGNPAASFPAANNKAAFLDCILLATLYLTLTLQAEGFWESGWGNATSLVWVAVDISHHRVLHHHSGLVHLLLHHLSLLWVVVHFDS